MSRRQIAAPSAAVDEWLGPGAMTERSSNGIEGTLHVDGGTGVVRLRARYPTDVSGLWSVITDPQRLGLWYGTIEGELRVGGEFTLAVFASGWRGRGRVDICRPPHSLEVTMWSEEGARSVIKAELTEAGGETILQVERSDVPLDLLWAFGAGWHEHLEDLGALVGGRECADWSARGDVRFDELASLYRQLPVTAIER